MKLSSVSRELEHAFVRASLAKRRAAVAEACEWAVARLDVDDPAVIAVLNLLRFGRITPESGATVYRQASTVDEDHLCSSLKRAAEWESAQRLAISEKDDPWGKRENAHFVRAQLLSALVVAAAGDPNELHEVLYRALSAINRDATVLAAVMKALR